jgi:hypothetical protein
LVVFNCVCADNGVISYSFFFFFWVSFF